MARAFVVLALLAAGTAGCDGALSTGLTGGAGSGGTTGGGGGAAGSPDPTDYRWGDVSVHVGPTSADVLGFSLQVLDAAHPDALTVSTVPAASGPNAHDGAYAAALYRCVSPGLYEVDTFNCWPGDHAVTAPGCVAIQFTEAAVTGSYTDANGDGCGITGGSATIDLPPPGARSIDGGPPDPVVGTFKLDCAHADGTHLLLTGRFVVPVDLPILIC
jgi:hypothetical protein